MPRYTGTSGRTQGDINDNIPAINAERTPISTIILSFTAGLGRLQWHLQAGRLTSSQAGQIQSPRCRQV